MKSTLIWFFVLPGFGLLLSLCHPEAKEQLQPIYSFEEPRPNPGDTLALKIWQQDSAAHAIAEAVESLEVNLGRQSSASESLLLSVQSLKLERSGDLTPASTTTIRRVTCPLPMDTTGASNY